MIRHCEEGDFLDEAILSFAVIASALCEAIPLMILKIASRRSQ